MPRKQIGQRIRSHRMTKHVTQRQLANGLHITFQQLQKYENGTDAISAQRLYEISIFLGVPPGAFFPNDANGDDDLSALLDRPDAVRMARIFKSVCGKWRPMLINIIEACANRRYPSCEC